MEERFIGREKELHILNEAYADPNIMTAAVYGRRRLGKTFLLKEFCRDKRHIFFVAGQTSERMNLNAFEDCLRTFTDKKIGPYRDFAEAFSHLVELADGEDIVLVIDEFPFLVKTSPYISSLVQRYVDHEFRKKNIFLILCGSSMHTMKDELEEGEAPLFGRFLYRFELKPMSYADTKAFYPERSDDDVLRIYGAVGGTPLYHTLFRDGDVEDEIFRLFLMNNGIPLSAEAENLVLMELSPVKVYTSVLTAMSKGSNRVSTIADKAGIDAPMCSKCLDEMGFLGLVRKEKYMANSRRNHPEYTLRDNLLRFHHGVAERCRILMNNGDTEGAKKAMHVLFQTHMGQVFESVCAEFVTRKFPCMDIGRWRGSDPKTLTDTDIDIVAEIMDGDSSYGLLAECKYSVNKVGSETLNTLQARASQVTGFKRTKLALFSRSGFTDELEAYAKDEGILLFTAEDLFG